MCNIKTKRDSTCLVQIYPQLKLVNFWMIIQHYFLIS
ncbi:unnamed protein product [Paramecium octaurelia]|uniref:Uncharacterized protein n=1 Tax=Paramecium octaurelia TaxID=43137 RepID=A0A8S1SWJ9_PAROT|nr:unnamed protein product [Paramecium octaurelia]